MWVVMATVGNYLKILTKVKTQGVKLCSYFRHKISIFIKKRIVFATAIEKNRNRFVTCEKGQTFLKAQFFALNSPTFYGLFRTESLTVACHSEKPMQVSQSKRNLWGLEISLHYVVMFITWNRYDFCRSYLRVPQLPIKKFRRFIKSPQCLPPFDSSRDVWLSSTKSLDIYVKTLF